MKTKNALCGLSMAVVLQLGMLAGSAQDAYSTNADGSIYNDSTNADGSANIVAYTVPYGKLFIRNETASAPV